MNLIIVTLIALIAIFWQRHLIRRLHHSLSRINDANEALLETCRQLGAANYQMQQQLKQREQPDLPATRPVAVGEIFVTRHQVFRVWWN